MDHVQLRWGGLFERDKFSEFRTRLYHATDQGDDAFGESAIMKSDSVGHFFSRCGNAIRTLEKN